VVGGASRNTLDPMSSARRPMIHRDRRLFQRNTPRRKFDRSGSGGGNPATPEHDAFAPGSSLVTSLQPHLLLLVRRPGFVAGLELQKIVQGDQGDCPRQQNERTGVAKDGGVGSRHLHHELASQHRH
jgi:hypothetical protein